MEETDYLAQLDIFEDKGLPIPNRIRQSPLDSKLHITFETSKLTIDFQRRSIIVEKGNTVMHLPLEQLAEILIKGK